MVAQQRFRITGFPRSGLAWLSVFLTTGESFCAHEARKWGADKILEPRPEPYIGDACSGYAVERAPVDVVVQRPRVEVWKRLNEIEDFRRYFSKVQISHILDRCEEGMMRAVENGAMPVAFRELFTLDSLEAIWHRCLGEPFTEPDKKRAELLTRLNIQTDIAQDAAMLGYMQDTFHG